jgi:hypothetical protein
VAKQSAGQLVNLLSSDTEKLYLAATYFTFVMWALLELVVICILAIAEMGPAALGGALIIFMLTPMNLWVAKQVAVIRQVCARCPSGLCNF